MPFVDCRDYEVRPVFDGYDGWAPTYDDGANALLALEAPVVEALLGEVAERDVLDLGCGTGRHLQRLVARGARVVGVDGSEGMLERAAAKLPTSTLVRFDIRQPLGFLEDDSFDRVLCALALEHVDPLVPVYAEMRRVCRPGGAVVVSCMHPAMMLRGMLAHFTDHRGVDVQPRSHPHEITDFVMAAREAGLVLDVMGEHTVDALLADFPRMERYAGWPMLLTLRFVPA